MKALVLAAGRGTRVGAITETVNKCFLEVAGKPLIEYSLDHIYGIPDIDEIVMVVGYKSEAIRQRYKNSFKDKKITYVEQPQQKGLVHAIESARTAIADADFMLMLGDEFMTNPRHKGFVDEFKKNETFTLCGMLRVTDKTLISKTYAVLEDDRGRIYRLIEKPAKAQNDLMGTGNCLFKNKIFEYIKDTPINQKRGEKELPDLIQCAIDDGNVVKYFLICDEYVNVNNKEELNKTASYFTHL